MREFVAAKIHGLIITGKSLDYEGSATIPESLMLATGIQPYERVYLVNKNNGERWDTYALPGPEHEFVMNGAAARMGEIGDEILLWTFRTEDAYSGANVLIMGAHNQLKDVEQYPAAPLAPPPPSISKINHLPKRRDAAGASPEGVPTSVASNSSPVPTCSISNS